MVIMEEKEMEKLLSERLGFGCGTAGVADLAGNKIMPLHLPNIISVSSELTTLCSTSNSSSNNNEDEEDGKKDLCKDEKIKRSVKNNSFKIKAMARMKDFILRSKKGGTKTLFITFKVLFYFRNRERSIKAEVKFVDDMKLNNESTNIESPKISFKWEMESCCCSSTISSSTNFSATSSPYTKPNWITTDSDYVVLEL